MSFTWFADQPLRTEEQVAREVHAVSLSRDLDELASVLALMCIRQESNFWCPANNADPSSLNYPHDSLSDDGRSVAYFQQQNGRPGDALPAGDPDNWWGPMSQRMDLAGSCNEFLARLGDGYTAASNAATAGQFIQRVQGSAFPDAYAKHWDYCWDLLRRALADTAPSTPVGDPVTTDPRLALLEAARPDFNEYDVLVSQNFQDRDGTEVDLILGHTEESSGYDNADGLAHWLESTTNTGNPVSYHRTLSKGQYDDGVTVCNVVPIDKAAWAVGNSNNRSINMCFAGSTVNWTRQQWIDNCGRCFDVFAYLAVRDAITLGWTSIPVIPGPNYDADPPGVSDHRYCSDYLRDGNNHVDMGDNVPWDIITASVEKYWAIANSAPDGDNGAPDQPAPVDDLFQASDGEKQNDILAQTRGRWGRLGKNKTGPAAGLDRTIVEAIGFLVDKAEGTDNSGNTDFSW